jgi:hypothetical protein
MKLIIIFGPHAVGKMTVGQALSKITDIPLFHNHVSIELALSLLGQDKNWQALSNEIREVVFKHVANAEGKGLIFTFMWALEHQADHDYIKQLSDLFKSKGATVYYVELYADKDIRIDRNQTENRLKEKPSKQDIKTSLDRFLRLEDKYRLNSFDQELKLENYIKIDNTHLEPDEVAKQIKDYFKL